MNKIPPNSRLYNRPFFLRVIFAWTHSDMALIICASIGSLTPGPSRPRQVPISSLPVRTS